jgi:hypothetical protein
VELVGWSDCSWLVLSKQKDSQFVKQPEEYGVIPSRWRGCKALLLYARKFPFRIPTDLRVIPT